MKFINRISKLFRREEEETEEFYNAWVRFKQRKPIKVYINDVEVENGYNICTLDTCTEIRVYTKKEEEEKA